MPSQNLPKPNLPDQGNAHTVFSQSVAQASQPFVPPAQPAQSTPPVPPVPPAQPTIQAQSPVQGQSITGSESVIQPQQLQKTSFPAQVVPGGLSRENPGGTPPNMKMAMPAPNLTSAQLMSQAAAVPKNDQLLSKPNASPRPMSPLDQISLSSSAKPSSNSGLTQVNSSASSTANLIADTNLINPNPSVIPPTQIVRPVSPAVATTTASSASSDPSNTTATPKPNTAQVQNSSSSTNVNSGGGILGKLKSKKSLLILLIGGGVLLLIILIALLLNSFKAKTNTAKLKTSTTSGNNTNTSGTNSSAGQITTLTYWGLWEDSQILKEVIADFESKNPTIKIDYRKQSHRDYRERLQQAILSGNGPDIFRYHVAWTPMLSADLAALPAGVMSVAQFKETFYETAYNNLQVNGQIVGIPLMYDGLALFYNKEMLKTANLEVPRTWAELRTAANKLTVPANISERSNLVRAGLAIGNAGNVDHFSDILALLIIQNGGNPAEATSQYVKDAITFYTNFIKQDKIWSDRLANSTTAFAKGDVAMIFAPSWRIHDIKAINPQLDFAVASVPQLDADRPVSWASFWAEGVSAKSKNKEAAWNFLKYLSTPEVLRKFYNSASQFRAFGEIYPRRDMASELANSEMVAAYVNDAPLAKSWYMASFTHDNGINDQIIKYYEDAVNAVLSGSDVSKALETTKAGVNSVITKYASSK